MAVRLNSADPSFSEQLDRLAARTGDVGESVRAAVAEIIDAVRERGFRAVEHYTATFDGFRVDEASVRIAPERAAAAVDVIDPPVRRALELAADRIRAFHERQRPADERWTDASGVTLGWRWTPVDAAGLYAPGGRAAYPSSVLMNAIPAKTAGVARLALCVPTPRGEANPAVLAAAHLAGIDEIYCIGGAQAIAALAYGAGPIRPVDVIVGPGNAYVAEAKRQVFGRVGIDAIAGPSEILVIADGASEADWVAADLLSQAEHDPSSQSVLVTTDPAFAEAVSVAVERQIAASPRAAIAEQAWTDNSAIIVVGSLAEAATVANRLAPEHLELSVADPEALLPLIRHAGAIFLGRHMPEAMGDYLAGPNHVLPTAGAARHASGLSVLAFMKRTTLIGGGAEALKALGPAAAALADAEGLPSHADSIRRRLV